MCLNLVFKIWLASLAIFTYKLPYFDMKTLKEFSSLYQKSPVKVPNHYLHIEVPPCPPAASRLKHSFPGFGEGHLRTNQLSGAPRPSLHVDSSPSSLLPLSICQLGCTLFFRGGGLRFLLLVGMVVV